MGVINGNGHAAPRRPDHSAHYFASVSGGQAGAHLRSRATGHAHRASDIDLAISAPDISAAEWRDLCEALECTPIIYDLDIVREEDVIDEQLRAAMQRDGIVVYRSDV